MMTNETTAKHRRRSLMLTDSLEENISCRLEIEEQSQPEEARRISNMRQMLQRLLNQTKEQSEENMHDSSFMEIDQDSNDIFRMSVEYYSNTPQPPSDEQIPPVQARLVTPPNSTTSNGPLTERELQMEQELQCLEKDLELLVNRIEQKK